LNARSSLPIIPDVPTLFLKGSAVNVKAFNFDEDYIRIAEACNGGALYNGSDYDPSLMWTWLLQNKDENLKDSVHSHALGHLYNKTSQAGCHLVVIDTVLQKQIGMVSLVDNSPSNLSIRIDNLWITPPFQGLKRSHASMYLILNWLFKSGYRRVTVELDERHIIGRKFFTRCGFELEAILRKHRIVGKRNSNTALLVMLNSDWQQEGREKRLRQYLQLPDTVTVKVAEMDVTTQMTLDSNTTKPSSKTPSTTIQ